MDTFTHSPCSTWPTTLPLVTDYGELPHLRLGRVDLPSCGFGIKAGLQYLRPGSFCSGFIIAVDMLSRTSQHHFDERPGIRHQHIKPPRYECCNIVDLSRLEKLPAQIAHSCSRIKLNNGTLCGLGARYPPLQVFPSLVYPICFLIIQRH